MRKDRVERCAAVSAQLALWLTVAPAAAGAAECNDVPALSTSPSTKMGHVGGAARTYFVKGHGLDPACPAATASCRDKAFLVSGNAVILGERQGGFVCASYVGRNGAVRTGWLPADAVMRDPAGPAPALDAWTGTWVHEEGEIRIKPAAKAGELTVVGEASYGTRDPDRVKRGAVNMGSIEGTRAPNGANLTFAMGRSGTLPVDKGEATDCKVWLRRLGPYLLTDDNNACGGMNVTFRGIYTKLK